MIRLEPNFIVGYTTRLHLLLDLDDTSFPKVYRLVYKIMRQWPKLGDCLIVLSSAKKPDIVTKYSFQHLPYHKVVRPNYHLVFNNRVGYNFCCQVCETLAWLGCLNRDYVKIRTFRGDMTLRVSHQNMSDGSVKPMPRPVRRCVNMKADRSDGMIDVYLGFLDACRRLFPIADMVPKVGPNRAADEPLEAEHEERRQGLARVQLRGHRA